MCDWCLCVAHIAISIFNHQITQHCCCSIKDFIYLLEFLIYKQFEWIALKIVEEVNKQSNRKILQFIGKRMRAFKNIASINKIEYLKISIHANKENK